MTFHSLRTAFGKTWTLLWGSPADLHKRLVRLFLVLDHRAQLFCISGFGVCCLLLRVFDQVLQDCLIALAFVFEERLLDSYDSLSIRLKLLDKVDSLEVALHVLQISFVPLKHLFESSMFVPCRLRNFGILAFDIAEWTNNNRAFFFQRKETNSTNLVLALYGLHPSPLVGVEAREAYSARLSHNHLRLLHQSSS